VDEFVPRGFGFLLPAELKKKIISLLKPCRISFGGNTGLFGYDIGMFC